MIPESGMKLTADLMRKAFLFLFLVGAMGAFSTPAHAQATGTVVFDSIPSPIPGNVVSKGFQCCQTAELGDEITLEGDTPRRLGFVTVLMSSWSLHSNYPAMDAAGYTHPITLNIYRDATEARRMTPWVTVTLDSHDSVASRSGPDLWDRVEVIDRRQVLQRICIPARIRPTKQERGSARDVHLRGGIQHQHLGIPPYRSARSVRIPKCRPRDCRTDCRVERCDWRAVSKLVQRCWRTCS